MKIIFIGFIVLLFITTIAISTNQEKIGQSSKNPSEIKDNTTENESMIGNEILREDVEVTEKTGKRVIAKEKVLASKRAYVNAKEKLAEARLRFLDKKRVMLYQRNKFRECQLKDDFMDSDECKSIIMQFKAHSKSFLDSASEIILNSLYKVRANIESNEDIDEETATNIIEEINSRISLINEIRKDIEKLDSESSYEVIKRTRDDLKNAIVDAKVTLRYAVAILVKEKISGILVKSEKLELKLQDLLNDINKNKDISDLQRLLDDFSSKIDIAKQDLKEANELLSEKDDRSVREAHLKLKEAHKYLQETHKILKEILKGINAESKILVE